MSTALVIQTFILSGAFGFITLDYLQNNNAVTKTLSESDKGVYRVIYGIIDYVIYLLVSTAVGSWHLSEAMTVLLSVLVTVMIVTAYTLIYQRYAAKHTDTKNGMSRLTTRENAFTNTSNGNVQADVFNLQGQYISSGLVHDVDLADNLSGDVSLIPLPKKFTANKTVDSASDKADLEYVDAETGLIYFVTYFSAPDEED